jgi:dUTPase
MLCFYKSGEQGQSPLRGSTNAAGFDLAMPHTVTVLPGKTVSVDLLISVSLPVAHFGLITLRSGAVRRHPLILHAGVIGG